MNALRINSTAKTRGQFMSLKNSVANALIELSLRELEASNLGDAPLAEGLSEARTKIAREMLDLRLAEIAFVQSEGSVSQGVKRLARSVDAAQEQLKLLKDLTTSAQAAQEILSLIRGLEGDIA
jgi:putative component of toxin-antitoxin plasmid stabilization module